MKASNDPLAKYRRIRNLTVIGPAEWRKALMTKENPLNLPANWQPECPTLPELEKMKAIAKLSLSKAWDTPAILWLALQEVSGQPTSLANQYKWWGVPHDGMGPGNIRKDVFYSNWFIGKYDWANEPAVTEPTWIVGYELPIWTTSKNRRNQQLAVSEHGMNIATATRDALMLNLVLAATGKRLRRTTYARTTTICDGYPLVVGSFDDGVYVGRCWDPDDGFDRVGASVEGVSKELGF